MSKYKIYLSLGVIPWLGINDAITFAKECGFDGIELLPTRKVSQEIKNDSLYHIRSPENIESIHQSWRLDIGHDHDYDIGFISSFFYTVLRFVFFPPTQTSKKIITTLSKIYNIPVTVHTISDDWTKDDKKNEFEGGINFEILEEKQFTKNDLKKWLEDSKHSMVIDTRDDQSLRWAVNNGFRSFEDFWTWIGIDKIKNVQLTLIGRNGIEKILNHKETLAEKELHWLNKVNWKGSVIVEVNPLMLFFVTRKGIKTGLREIVLFIHTVLDNNKKWSKEF